MEEVRDLTSAIRCVPKSQSFKEPAADIIDAVIDVVDATDDYADELEDENEHLVLCPVRSDRSAESDTSSPQVSRRLIWLSNSERIYSPGFSVFDLLADSL